MRHRTGGAPGGINLRMDRRTTALYATGSHRRWNALAGEWILVSPQRTQRPWQGALETQGTNHRPEYDPQCYLCPGNVRANGATNPAYADTFAFSNDFPALSPAAADPASPTTLFAAESVSGECRVLCYSPRHDLSLGELPLESLEKVIDLWREQWTGLAAQAQSAYALIFENRGEMMGASNPHPHGQIWATNFLPDEVVKEQGRQRDHWQAHGRPLLLDYVQQELANGERIVHTQGDWVALVPFWAVWPFELMILPKRAISSFDQLSPQDRTDLAVLLKAVARIYDGLFGVPFPYSMGWHTRPCDGAHPDWMLHAHFYPPLLRSATIKKFQVGFEMLGMPQRDITPEAAAEKLRQVDTG